MRLLERFFIRPLWLWLWLMLFGLTGCSSHGRFTTLEPVSSEEHWFAAQQTWVVNPMYYAQAVAGHLKMVSQARPIDDWLAQKDLPDVQRKRLQKAQEMRRFASEVLALPQNKSYTRYVDLQRTAVVWNVIATPAFSLDLHRWCFPFAGCVGYRGFYSQQAAQSFATQLPQDWDVKVYPVSAYSTLGWTHWLGGDPLLNTMLAFPELELAELLFHELAHQRVYIKGDTTFNESYATAVERLGAKAWKAHRQADPDFEAVWAQHQLWQSRRQAFQTLLRRTRQELDRLYAHPITSWQTGQDAKARVMRDFEDQYADLRSEWGGQSRFDAWVQPPNNAIFAIQHSYTQWVPAFEQLHADMGGDWAAFHEAVEALGRLPRPQRELRLLELQKNQ